MVNNNRPLLIASVLFLFALLLFVGARFASLRFFFKNRAASPSATSSLSISAPSTGYLVQTLPVTINYPDPVFSGYTAIRASLEYDPNYLNITNPTSQIAFHLTNQDTNWIYTTPTIIDQGAKKVVVVEAYYNAPSTSGFITSAGQFATINFNLLQSGQTTLSLLTSPSDPYQCYLYLKDQNYDIQDTSTQTHSLTIVSTTPPPSLTPTLTPIPTFCSDSDSGDNPFTPGSISTNAPTWPTTSSDTCSLSTANGYTNVTSCTGSSNCFVSEYYCVGNNPNINFHNCPLGCNLGACLNSSSITPPPTTPIVRITVRLQNPLPNPGLAASQLSGKVIVLATPTGSNQLVINPQTITATTSGNLTMDVDLGIPQSQLSTVSLKIKVPGFLQRNLGSVSISQAVTVVDWSNTPLLAGDVYGTDQNSIPGFNDNQITQYDVNSILALWTQLEVPLSSYSVYDFNFDAKISQPDINLILSNWTSLVVNGEN